MLVVLASQTLAYGDPVVAAGNISGYHFVITLSLVIYWIIAAIVGIVAESIVGWRLPFGIIGAIAASLLGIWLLTEVVPVNISGDIMIAGVPIPLIKAFIGAVIVVTIWHVLTFPSWRRRHRYYRGYRDEYRRDYR
jgi:uncharacterized membrane protein YeaQ/YmgE (transglycosylase-associated protein family)